MLDKVVTFSLFLSLVFIKFWKENILSTFADEWGIDKTPATTLEISGNIYSSSSFFKFETLCQKLQISSFVAVFNSNRSAKVLY